MNHQRSHAAQVIPGHQDVWVKLFTKWPALGCDAMRIQLPEDGYGIWDMPEKFWVAPTKLAGRKCSSTLTAQKKSSQQRQLQDSLWVKSVRENDMGEGIHQSPMNWWRSDSLSHAGPSPVPVQPSRTRRQQNMMRFSSEHADESCHMRPLWFHHLLLFWSPEVHWSSTWNCRLNHCNKIK